MGMTSCAGGCTAGPGQAGPTLTRTFGFDNRDVPPQWCDEPVRYEGWYRKDYWFPIASNGYPNIYVVVRWDIAGGFEFHALS
jgi:hypothetical protein